MKGLIERAYAEFSSDTINTNGGQGTTLTTLVANVVKWVSVVVGVLAFFYLIYAGILYITAGGNPDQAKKGQQGILYAIIGIIITVLAYTITQVAFNTAAGTT